MQQTLNFFPLPHGQGSFRPVDIGRKYYPAEGALPGPSAGRPRASLCPGEANGWREKRNRAWPRQWRHRRTTSPPGPPPPPVKRHPVRALPERCAFEILFPRVEGGFSLLGPGRTDEATLRAFREGKREQWLVFELAKEMTKRFAPRAEVPAHRLFLQLRAIVERFLREKVDVAPLGDRKDLFLAPYFGWALERLLEAVRPDLSAGEAPELPVPEKHMPPGTTADVDFVSPQRPAARLRPRLHRPAGHGRSEDPDRRDEGLRPATGGQEGRRGKVGPGRKRRRLVRPLVLCPRDGARDDGEPAGGGGERLTPANPGYRASSPRAGPGCKPAGATDQRAETTQALQWRRTASSSCAILARLSGIQHDSVHGFGLRH
jgi:hypothetical protein